MEPLAMLKADPLDLLFENRNKMYGAYPLRKYYPQRLLISLGVVFSGVVLGIFLCWFGPAGAGHKTGGILPPDIHLQDVNFVSPGKPVLTSPKPAGHKPPATVQYNTPLIVADQKVPEPLATVDQIRNDAIGIKTSGGDSDNGELHVNGNAGVGMETQKSDPAENKEAILDIAEVMPEFPGGIEALKRFLLKNLRMPENALEGGEQVKVIGRFVVGMDGRVRDIEIVQAADPVFNREVKRVIAKMPDWKPGSQNHRNVAVYFNLPVNFVGTD